MTWNQTFLGTFALLTDDSGGSEEIVTGRQGGLPRDGGNDGVIGLSLKTGFRQSTETESC